jgi:hypothetical protein
VSDRNVLIVVGDRKVTGQFNPKTLRKADGTIAKHVSTGLRSCCKAGSKAAMSSWRPGSSRSSRGRGQMSESPGPD